MKGDSYRPDKMLRIPSSFDSDFFYNFVLFLRPFHGLTPKEMELLAAFIRKRQEFKEKTGDEGLSDKLVMSDTVKREIREECGLTPQHYQGIVRTLKSKGAIQSGRINPKFIPVIKEENRHFDLLIRFDRNDRQQND